MESILSIMLLTVAVVVANILSLIWPKVPLAVYQIIAGLLLSLDPQFNHFALEPELFMLAIIAPLMFNDGQNQSTRSLSKNISSILSMSVFLAIFTVLVVGFSAHMLWPTMALPITLMLAAIITPTDAVAVNSITKNVILPERVHTTLTHESLFNDASGIVLFNLALGAYTTGSFSLGLGILDFIKVFFGGIFFGLIVGTLIVQLRLHLTQSHADISAIVIPINIMTPLVIYWSAERLGLSGILAVVATGLVHSILHDRLQLTSTKLQIVTSTTWTIIEDILNGFVFVLLGATLPTVITSNNITNISLLVLIAVGLYLTLFLIRYLWVRFGLVKLKRHTANEHQSAWQVALGGVHGTITLAMAFSIPTMINHHLFVYRDQIILIAAIVILISLLVPAIVFPLTLPVKQKSYTAAEFDHHVNRLVSFAVAELKQNNQTTEELRQATETLASQANIKQTVDRKQFFALANQARQIEQTTIEQLNDQGQISNQTQAYYERFLERTAFRSSNRSFTKLLWHRLKRSLNKRLIRRHKPKLSTAEIIQKKAAFKTKQAATIEVLGNVSNAVITYLDSIENADNRTEVAMLRRTYTARTRFINDRQTLESDLLQNLFIQAFQSEHTYVQQELASQNISQELANHLNEKISTDELVYMQSMT
ncbi:cation:proton antiporter [Paucilactobacillus kaifaensis]|uniref:cation:proton antiporter n=1 Tax=Paucilactobacillus kaifaensis TaxID=2559921 RepID=UPI0010F80F9B|nr:sodium:proton antiporter [Paucilactobacillus kaifaensis]